MRTVFPLLVLSLIASFVIACSGDDDAVATPVVSPTATIAVTANAGPTDTPESGATAEATATTPAETPAPPASAGEIGPQSIDDGYQDLIGSMYSDCTDLTDVECMNRIVEDADVSAEVKAFWQDYQAFLVDFEEYGAVDYGAVSSPTANMARPEPVFLNGNFGLQYLSELVPTDWQSADPSYAELPDVIAWVEYGTLTDVSTTGDQQTFTMALPIRACRACVDLGNLNLEVTYTAGDMQGVRVLPMTEVSPTPNP